MRVEAIATRVLGKRIREIHAKRVAVMLAAVAGIVRAQRLSLSRVGRALASKAKPKHSIKRVDRLLSNAGLGWPLTARVRITAFTRRASSHPSIDLRRSNYRL